MYEKITTIFFTHIFMWFCLCSKNNLDASESEILEVSMVGFDTKEVILEKNTNITITLEEGLSLQEVVVVGSRNPNRTAVDTAVPVDVIDIKELTSAGPQVNVTEILNYVAPSFTSNTQNISDGTDHIEPASLRSLGPDQVLVLINGKRRHNSSLVNVNGTFGRGSVGTDMNTIPSASIKRIEILRDGAAAQYGSDAIAGVINIVLKTSVNELSLNVTSGANFSENANSQTGGVDGETINIAANYGIPLGKDGGFINLTGDFDYQKEFNRMREFEGDIFNLYNTIENLANEDNYDLTLLLDDDLADINQYGNDAGLALTGTETKEELQTILAADNTEAELAARGLDRTDFNMRVGQSRLRSGRVFANLSLPIDNLGTELYSFAGASTREGNSAGFYRLPNQARTFTPAYLNGFLPEINSVITDKSISGGIRGKINDWNIDVSNTWGQNTFLYVIGNTFNASLQNASPFTFDAGGFSFTQNTFNVDVNKFHEDIFEGLNIAFGAEYRSENYEIFAGEEGSYGQYTAEGELITIPTQVAAVDFFGNSRPGGAQVFPGFRPENALSRDRNSVAGYADFEADISENFLTSFATRFENYSDFGSTINFKLATRLKLNENINLRAAGNTGFRAPSLQQLNYNSVSTVFVDGIAQDVGIFSNDSRVASLLGIPQLKEETSKSVSVGFTAKIPAVNISLTVDGYFIRIDDRVVLTGTFEPQLDDDDIPINDANEDLASLLDQAGASGAAFFANAIDTESKGIDIVITHKANIGGGKLKSDLSATFSETFRVGDINSSDVLQEAGLDETYFDETSRVFLEEAVPRTKINLTNNYSIGKFNAFLRNVFFGPVSEATNTVENQQVYTSKIVTDLSAGYQLTDALNLTVGANNLFDIYPDRAIEANRSSGRFDFSRRSQQFGIGGRYLFARLNFVLK